MRFIENPELLIGFVPAILIALTFHEYAHARVAYAYGDRTAERAGRLTLNPVSHLDPIGTLMILLAGIGWARPVPINPYVFRDVRQGLLWVSLAGPLANFGLAFISIFVMSLMISAGFTSDIMILVMTSLVQLNLILGIFNLLPLPPLDGSKILTSILPPSSLATFRQIEAYAPLILILLIVFGVLGAILFPIAGLIFTVFDTIVTLITGVSVRIFFPFTFF